MSELSQLQRTLRILQVLSVRDRVTVKDLFEHFDRQIPQRTLQRTLVLIEESSLPLRRETGAHGQLHFSLERRFHFLPELLNADEALAAILLAQFGEHFEGTPVGQALAQVIEKLEQLLPLNGVVARSGILGLGDTFRIKQPGRVQGGAGGQVLLRLLQAILERRVCRVRYRKLGAGGEGREYLIHPYSLALVAGAIYLVSRQAGAESWISLAAQRFVQVDLLEDTFEREPGFDLGTFLNGSFGVWQSEPAEVRLEFSAIVAEFVQERLWHPSQELEQREDGSVSMAMSVGLSSELEAWILRWGPHCRVLGPPPLRARIRELLGQALAAYDDGTPTA
ncbi:MAG: WYL domain-containing protein [Candidatus Cloacimonetes bacterium]|nr:WYL domain-containing protein [Candidatus Cloacimonadota bacterium]